MTWRRVPGHPTIEVNDRAQVRRRTTNANGGWATKGHIYAQRVMLHGRSQTPYKAIRVAIDGKRRWLRVHRIVCLAFHGKQPSRRHQVAHRDCKSLNNTPRNLRWAVPVENAADTLRTGRYSRGEKHGKLKNSEVLKIRRLCKAKVPQREVAELFKISQCMVHNIHKRKAWTHL